MENTKPPYLFPELPPPENLLALADPQPQMVAPELTRRRILWHLFWFLLTVVTTTLTGALWSVDVTGEPASEFEAIIAPFSALYYDTLAGNYEALGKGVLFMATILIILAAHEFGHYFACRYYKIRATLPYFIPAPPLFTPFGTFGAVIKIKEPIYSRRALFDIGIAGPLAGFVFALPASFIGLYFAEATPPLTTGGVQFHDPLLFMLINKIFGLPQWILWNPVYWAAWGTLLVTALNLFPVGQLDGGHVLYAIAGQKIHKAISIAVTVALASLAIVSVWLYDSPTWLIWSIVLLILLRVGHPPVVDQSPLGRGRLILAIVALLVFLLCFMPFPITFS